MSKSENGKRPNPFEEAMKKIANTKVYPAIHIVKKDKKYTIPYVSGKWVQFLQLTVGEAVIDHFLLVICLQPEEGISECFHIFPTIDPYQKRKDTVVLDAPLVDTSPSLPEGIPAQQNPVFVPKDRTLKVGIISAIGYESEDLKYGASLTYKVLE